MPAAAAAAQKNINVANKTEWKREGKGERWREGSQNTGLNLSGHAFDT